MNVPCPDCGYLMLGTTPLLFGVRRGWCLNHGYRDVRVEQVAPPPPPPDRFEAGMEASEESARRWTDDEAADVDEAIERAARELELFTADDVWKRLPEDFPVTKGLAARLLVAVRGDLIEASGSVVASQRKGEHGHGQKLTLWRSKVWQP